MNRGLEFRQLAQCLTESRRARRIELAGISWQRHVERRFPGCQQRNALRQNALNAFRDFGADLFGWKRITDLAHLVDVEKGLRPFRGDHDTAARLGGMPDAYLVVDIR